MSDKNTCLQYGEYVMNTCECMQFLCNTTFSSLLESAALRRTVNKWVNVIIRTLACSRWCALRNDDKQIVRTALLHSYL